MKPQAKQGKGLQVCVPQGQGWRGRGRPGPHLHSVVLQAVVRLEQFVDAAIVTQLAAVPLDHPAGVIHKGVCLTLKDMYMKRHACNQWYKKMVIT